MSKPKRLRECDDWEEIPLFDSVGTGARTPMDYQPPRWPRETWLVLQHSIRHVPAGTKRSFDFRTVCNYLTVDEAQARSALSTLTTYGLLTFDAFKSEWIATGKARDVFKAFGLEALRKTEAP